MKNSSTATFVLIATLVATSPALIEYCEAASTPTIEQAVATGDRAMVEQAIQSNHANSVIADLARAMISGDAHTTIVSALRCVRGATNAHASQTALLCARVLGGTFLAEGDIGGWSRQMQWMRTVGFPTVMKTSGMPTRMDAGLDELDYANLTVLPRPLIRVDKTDSTLPLRDLDNLGRPAVDIEINGQTVRALIDTGASQMLTINKSLARKLGIDPVAQHLMVGGSDMLDSTDEAMQTQSLVVTRHIRIGPFDAQGLGATQFEGQLTQGVDAIVGLPLLLKLKGFEFGPHSATFYGASQPACEIEHPFTLSNNSVGRIRIQIPATIRQMPMQIFLDSGAQGPIILKGKMAREIDDGNTKYENLTLTTVEARYPLRSGFTKTRLSVLGHQFDDATMRLIPYAAGNVPILMGAYSLPALYFRVITEPKSACLISGKALSQHY